MKADAVGAREEDMPDWHQWCRLCAKEHPDNINVYLRDGEMAWSSMLAVAIGKYFWVNIKMDDELSSVLCRECHELVDELITFSERVNRVQTLFATLQQGQTKFAKDCRELRSRYGLDTDNWKHIISRSIKEESVKSNLAVDHYIEEVTEHYDTDVEILAEIEGEDMIDGDGSYETYSVHEAETETPEVAAAQLGHASKNDEIVEETHQDEALEAEEYAYETVATYENAEVDEDHEDTQKQYKCDVCMKIYKRPMAYKRHMMESHNIEPTNLPVVECKQCQLCFLTESQLTVHLKTTHLHAKEKRESHCNYCGRCFTTQAALKRHVAGMHDNLKPFMCDTCGKVLKTNTALTEHKLVHTDECPFECQVCHRRFKNKARLKIHADTHNSSNYECSICGLKLNTRRTLNMHKLVHSDEKQYKCDICGAAFKRGKTLKSHLILHTGIRPYKCNFCGKDFSNGSNCRMHKRKTHPEELAEEESRGVVHATLLPLVNELTEVSKRLKSPRKVTTPNRIQIKADTQQESESGTQTTEAEEDGDDAEQLYELVEDIECT